MNTTNVRTVDPVRDLYTALRYAERKPFNAAEVASIRAAIAKATGSN